MNKIYILYIYNLLIKYIFSDNILNNTLIDNEYITKSDKIINGNDTININTTPTNDNINKDYNLTNNPSNLTNNKDKLNFACLYTCDKPAEVSEENYCSSINFTVKIDFEEIYFKKKTIIQNNFINICVNTYYKYYDMSVSFCNLQNCFPPNEKSIILIE